VADAELGWVPTAALLAVGLITLALLAAAAVGALRVTLAASRVLSTSLAGRTRRVRGGLGELSAWRAARRSGGSVGTGA